MRETDLVNRIRIWANAGYRNSALITGIGDDCAILRSGKDDLVFTSDLLLEDRHFRLKTHSAADIGHQALARSLSDLAAMGSEPVFCLLSLAIPARFASNWINGFYKGLLALANKHRTVLAGGDLSQFEKVAVDVTCCGRVPRSKAILRSGAKPGDLIYVTGNLGAPRHRATPRVEVGIALRKLGVSAGMDLSDGLSLDLHRLCVESKVSAHLDSIPIARGKNLEDALHAGEDYELLFTTRSKKIPNKIAGVSISKIGTIAAGKPGDIFLEDRPLKPKGFDHFVS